MPLFCLRPFPPVTAAAALALLFTPSAFARTPEEIASGYGSIVTSNTGVNARSGLDINRLIGATTFYDQGYSGARSIIANVEGGLTWGAHESLGGTIAGGLISGGKVSEYIYGGTTANTGFVSTSVSTANSLLDQHATLVGQDLGGINNFGYQRGIAYGSTLWSAAVATTFTGANGGAYNGNFSFNHASLAFAYKTVIQTGIVQNSVLRRADVVNSSWNFSAADSNTSWNRAVDGLAYANPYTTIVASVGNAGPGPKTVTGIAAGLNVISVGATGTDTSSPVYNQVASFSSRSPSDLTLPGGTSFNVRARVDLVAPGQNLTLAYYGGNTGGNTGGTDPTGGSNAVYGTNAAGTSFSAPMVAGGVALLDDVGYALYSGNANARDARVIKAVLLNSASKLSGWTNNSTLTGGGALLTTQALDYAQGAGQLNMVSAFGQYTAGDADLILTNGQTNIQALGWDFGQVQQDALHVFDHNDYYFTRSFFAGDTITATLNWFVADTYGDTPGAASVNRFDNLYLDLYQTLSGVPTSLVASSQADYINTQHVQYSVQSPSSYMLRVRWAGNRFSDGTVSSTVTSYALAFSATGAPEPGSLALLGAAALPVWAGALRAKRRRKA